MTHEVVFIMILLSTLTLMDRPLDWCVAEGVKFVLYIKPLKRNAPST